MIMRRVALAAFALLGLAGCGSDSKSSPHDDGSGPPALDFERYDAAISAFLTDHGITGASGVVVHKDRGIVHVAGYGEYPADRLYLVASSSKVVSAGVLMRLADEGKLDLDGPIGQYVSAWGMNDKSNL